MQTYTKFLSLADQVLNAYLEMVAFERARDQNMSGPGINEREMLQRRLALLLSWFHACDQVELLGGPSVVHAARVIRSAMSNFHVTYQRAVARKQEGVPVPGLYDRMQEFIRAA